jgi:hypothetical protein
MLYLFYLPCAANLAPLLKLLLWLAAFLLPRALLHAYPALWPEQSLVQGDPRNDSSSSSCATGVFLRVNSRALIWHHQR